MPFDGNGLFGLPAGSIASTGNTILASTHNTPINDIASALSQTLLRTGVAPMSGNLNLNSNRITNLAAGSSAADAVRLDKVVVKDAGASQTITRTAAGDVLRLQAAEDGASVAALLSFDWNSASPAASDNMVLFDATGRDSNGNTEVYARDGVVITNPTSGAEDAVRRWGVVTGGSFSFKLGLSGAGLSPIANDGLALGAATFSFADLFLASGAVVNFNNGNYTITHSAGDLLFSGGVSIGNADTTLARSGAGALTVEGVALLRANQNLSELTDASAARTSLGLGTAATVNTGTSGGNVPLLNGTNTWSATQALTTSTGSVTPLTIDRTGGADSGVGLIRLNKSTGATTDMILFLAGSSLAGRIQTDADSTAYLTSSDARLKPEEDRQSIADAGSLIDALDPIRFKWRGGEVDYGFIVQDVHAVLPEVVVVGSPEGASPDDEGFTPWMLERGRFEPFLIAEVQSLRKRVAALEGA